MCDIIPEHSHYLFIPCWNILSPAGRHGDIACASMLRRTYPHHSVERGVSSVLFISIDTLHDEPRFKGWDVIPILLTRFVDCIVSGGSHSPQRFTDNMRATRANVLTQEK